MIRFLVDSILILGVLFAPWWVVLILATIGLFVFRYYAEAVVVGLLGDIIYGAVVTGLPWQGAVMLLLLLIVQFFRTKVRFYEGQQII